MLPHITVSATNLSLLDLSSSAPKLLCLLKGIDLGQASALCQIASFLSYWDSSRPSETTMQQRFCIPHSWIRPRYKTRTKPVLIMVKIKAALDLDQEPSFQ
jgi:hypothetical protein